MQVVTCRLAGGANKCDCFALCYLLTLLKKVLRMIKDIAAVTVVTAAMPAKYDVKAVNRWVKAYNACFKS